MSNTPGQTEEQEIEEEQETSISVTGFLGKVGMALWKVARGWRAPKGQDDEPSHDV